MSRLFERLPPCDKGTWYRRSPQARSASTLRTTKSENRTITEGFPETPYPDGYRDKRTW